MRERGREAAAVAWGKYQWESCDWRDPGKAGKEVQWHLAGFGRITSVYRVAGECWIKAF